jgi:hypothetical protein
MATIIKGVIELETLVVRSDAVVSAPMGNEVAMMDMDSGKYFVLDEVASVIWEQLLQPIRPAALCASLLDSYDVPAEQCHAEVLSFLQKAYAKGLVRIVA